MSFIKQILIFTHSLQREETFNKMQKLAVLLYHFHGRFLYINNEKDLIKNITPQTLVVSDLDPATKLGSLLFNHGVAWMLSWENFTKYFSQIFYLKKNPDRPQVCLAFLDKPLTNLLHDLFLLYGFQVHVANDKATLEEYTLPVLKNETLFHDPVDYFVFDIDGMGTSKKNKRDQIIKDFRLLIKSNSYIAVSLVKDFSRGSVYEDIVHSIKEINNVLLDAQEYSLFILQHLQAYRQAQLFEKLESPSFLFFEKNRKGRINRKKFSLGIRDGKMAYSYYTDENNRKDASIDQDQEQLLLRKQLTNWLKTYIQFHEEKKRRASFTFVEKAVSDNLLDKAEKIASFNANKKKESNQMLLIESKGLKNE